MANAVERLLWTLIWLLLLLVFGIWISIVCGVLYVFVSILASCISGFKSLQDVCHNGLDLANTLATNAVNGKTGF